MMMVLITTITMHENKNNTVVWHSLMTTDNFVSVVVYDDVEECTGDHWWRQYDSHVLYMLKQKQISNILQYTILKDNNTQIIAILTLYTKPLRFHRSNKHVYSKQSKQYFTVMIWKQVQRPYSVKQMFVYTMMGVRVREVVRYT